jgi:hypothetical protein
METTPRLYRGAAGSSRLPAKSVTPPRTLLPAATAHACCGGVYGAAAHAPPPVHLPTLYQVAVKTLIGAPCYGSVHALLRHPIRGHEEAFSQLVAGREVKCFRAVDFFFVSSIRTLPANAVTPPKTGLAAATCHACGGRISGAAVHAPPPAPLPPPSPPLSPPCCRDAVRFLPFFAACTFLPPRLLPRARANLSSTSVA